MDSGEHRGASVFGSPPSRNVAASDLDELRSGLYLLGDGPRYPFIDTQVARCGLDRYLSVQVRPKAKIQLAGEPATRLDPVFLAPVQVVINGSVILPLQTIHVGGLERNYRIWGRIPTESSYSTLAMYPLYSIMVAPCRS